MHGAARVREPVDQGQVERAASGCAAALAALIEAHYEAIYRMAWRLIGTREEAQDVAQDVCVKLAGAVRSFRGNAEFSTWLYRVAYNTAIDHMRARERLRRGERPDVVVLFQGRTAQSAEVLSSRIMWRARSTRIRRMASAAAAKKWPRRSQGRSCRSPETRR